MLNAGLWNDNRVSFRHRNLNLNRNLKLNLNLNLLALTLTLTWTLIVTLTLTLTLTLTATQVQHQKPKTRNHTYISSHSSSVTSCSACLPALADLKKTFEDVAVLNNVLYAAVRVAAFDQPYDTSIYLSKWSRGDLPFEVSVSPLTFQILHLPF